MNLAVLVYTFLLRTKKLRKIDLVFDAMLIVACFGSVMQGPGMVQRFIDLLMNPATMMIMAWGFATDSMVKGTEYQALLFTRPLTRSSYVVSKTLMTWLGAQFVFWKCFVALLAANLLLHPKTVTFFTGWDLLYIVANTLSFGALAVAVHRLPTKWAGLAYILLFYSYLGGAAMPAGLKFTGSAQSATVPMEMTREAFSHVLYPVIDLEAVFHSTTFSIVPILAYISNILIYITVATIMLNRRELSYAQD